MRRLRKPEKVIQELYQRVLRQKKCEPTGLRTALSGVFALSAWEVDDDGGVPAMCFDYYISKVFLGGECVPVMVGREKRTKMMIAHVMLVKGGGVDWLVGQLLRDVRKMGSRKDGSQERPRERLLNDFCKQMRTENDSPVTLVESSPKGESQSNGLAERAVQYLEGGVRTHQLDLKAKLRTKEKPQGGLMLERCLQGVWHWKRSTTDERVIGP